MLLLYIGIGPWLAMNLSWVILLTLLLLFWNHTCITLMGRPVSFATCSLIKRVGLGVCSNTFLRTSSCLALIVVLGPLFLSSLSSFFSSSSSLSSSLSSFSDSHWDSGDSGSLFFHW